MVTQSIFVYKNNPLNDGTYKITSKFGYRNSISTSAGKTSNSHKGIDLGTSGVSHPIFAVSDGTVKTVSYDADGWGNYIRISHEQNVETLYAHMAERSRFNVGDKVSAGDQIGNVGTTGKSTGLHLHFEIRVNGTPVDPEPYMKAGGPTALSSNYDVTSATESESTTNAAMYSINAGGLTVGQRSSGLTTQPLHAFVNIYVGDNMKLLSTEPPRPNTLQSFEYNRLDDAGETASFTLFDDNWEEIEKVLASNFDRIYIEYGYYGTGLKSKIIRHLLLNYSISFTSTGSIISVQSVTQGVYDNLKPVNMALNTYNPTEAVKRICEALGYTVLDENFDKSQDIEADNPFNLIEEFPITYIYNTIIPQSAKENEEIFSFDIDSDGVAYFKRTGISSDKELLTTSLTDEMRTYIYQKGYDSPVIDLTFDLKGTFGGAGDFEINTGYRSSVFGTKDKSQGYANMDKSKSITSATGDTTHTLSSQSITVTDSAGYSIDQMKNIIYYKMKAPRYDAYGATMTILGDPTIKIFDYIRIINVTDNGDLHHTSGVYQVLGITDTIQKGEMITVLKLTRNATYNIDGLELLNPKLVVK